jgi:hypothetical protein
MYPEDFDGVVAGSPPWWLTHLHPVSNFSDQSVPPFSMFTSFTNILFLKEPSLE